MAKLQVLLISQFSASSQNYCYAEFLHKLVLEHGKTVRKFDCKRNFFPWGPVSADELPRVLRWANNLLINFQLLILLAWLRPGQLFLVKGENISAWILKLAKKILGCRLVNFYPDSPFCLWNGNSSLNVLRSFDLYDCFAIWARQLEPILLGAGVKSTMFWPFIPDNSLFFPAQAAERENLAFASQVCFVGSHDTKRELFLRHLKINLPNLDLKIWGLGWQDLSVSHTLKDSVQTPTTLNPSQMQQAFAQAKIVLNFLRPQNLGAHNMRTLEVVACGAFLLTERSDAQAQELLLENVSVACFEDPRELAEKVSLYLKLTPLREKIAQAGHRRFQALQQHYQQEFGKLL